MTASSTEILLRTSRQLICILAILSTSHAAWPASPDYRLWDEVLVTYVRNGFVDYDRLQHDPRFGQFTQQLGTLDAGDLSNSNDLKALLINAYNAFAILGILEGESTKSKRSRKHFFSRYKFPLLGKPTTLEDIEHKQLRKMGDPRIHFAIVCASLSCPRLNSRAFLPTKLDDQLDEAAGQFINDPTRNRFSIKRQEAFLSRIFDWFAEDFSGESGSVQLFMAGYIEDPTIADLLAKQEFRLNYDTYHWGLNGYFLETP